MLSARILRALRAFDALARALNVFGTLGVLDDIIKGIGTSLGIGILEHIDIQ